MGYIILLIALFAVCFCLAFGIIQFCESQRKAKLAKKVEEKCFVSESAAKAFELPIRQEKTPLYIFKNGKKQKFAERKRKKED